MVKLRGFKGYSLMTAIYRNKDMAKGILTLITGYAYLTDFNWKAFLLALSAASIAFVGKLLLDAFDYFFSEDPSQ